jgi:hypothetical protein
LDLATFESQLMVPKNSQIWSWTLRVSLDGWACSTVEISVLEIFDSGLIPCYYSDDHAQVQSFTVSKLLG